MLPFWFLVVLLSAVVDAKPTPKIEEPPTLALFNIVPDDFIKLLFELRAAERRIIESAFLEESGKFTTDDEKTKLFIEKIKENDPKVGEKLHKVIEKLTNKTALLSETARELFDLFLVKPNVTGNNLLTELKLLTKSRLTKWMNLSKGDKSDLKKHFPEIHYFFETLIADKQIQEFAGA